jgi:hypothetical protein
MNLEKTRGTFFPVFVEHAKSFIKTAPIYIDVILCIHHNAMPMLKKLNKVWCMPGWAKK